MSHEEGSWEKALCVLNLYGDVQVVDTENTAGQSTFCHIWRWKKCHSSLSVTQMESLVQGLNKQGWEKRATTSDIEESGLRKRKMSKRASYFTPQNIRKLQNSNLAFYYEPQEECASGYFGFWRKKNSIQTRTITKTLHILCQIHMYIFFFYKQNPSRWRVLCFMYSTVSSSDRNEKTDSPLESCKRKSGTTETCSRM